MKRGMLLILFSAFMFMLMVDFVLADRIAITGYDIANTNSQNNHDAAVSNTGTHLKADVKNIIKDRNVLGRDIKNTNNTDCPENCTCTGSVVKCYLNGGREMTITAGNSGNIIVKIDGGNMSTNVALYKSNDKVYGVFAGNNTREIRMLPDMISERVREKTKAKIHDENITLNENGNYTYAAVKDAKLFFFIPVKVKINANIDSETGNMTAIKHPWWAFLARDVKSEPLLGSSCGTVTPGQNDACCQSKGYDFWNMNTSQCGFNSSQ